MVLPDAGPTMAKLDVCILALSSPVGWARVEYRVLTGSRRDDLQLERHWPRLVEICAGRDCRARWTVR